MASKDKESRLAQMSYWEEQLNQQLARLAEQGISSEKIAKDTEIKKIRAKIRETRGRLAVIEEKEKKREEMAKAKAEKAAKPKEPKKKKKQEEEEEAESKRQQKKKKKKEKKNKD
ncbi:MAG: hypothetical protein LJE96_15465 [Deltaproteobacteria bacterium]|jgi:chromatin assembly factor 1 subunit A|nr:hypothetical protein [Deltaproteobacteria bacterium]